MRADTDYIEDQRGDSPFEQPLSAEEDARLEATDDVPPAEPIVHLAQCAECGYRVAYEPMPSGAGFRLRDSAESLGIGEHGRPLCPRGHGELAIADDAIPAEEAIGQVAEQLRTPAQQPLFEPPPFNAANALQEIFDKRHEIAVFEGEYEDAAAEAKKAREARDEARALLGKMIDRFEQESKTRAAEIARRREASEQPELAPVEEAAGDGAPAPDPELELLEELEQAAGVLFTLARLRALSQEEANELAAWSADAARHPEERDRWFNARPRALSGMHIAASEIHSEATPGDTYQCCAVCGARLVSEATGGVVDLNPYPSGTLVGEDCPGPSLPKKPRRKRATKKADD